MKIQYSFRYLERHKNEKIRVISDGAALVLNGSGMDDGEQKKYRIILAGNHSNG